MTAQHAVRPHRYHALDGLRAAMMGLGLVVHAACSYSAQPLGAAWPAHDPRHNGLAFDVIGGFVHAFRMPTFFAIAGFFGALLYHRRGAAGLAGNRVKRIALPLAAGYVLVTPLVHAAGAFAAGDGSAAERAARAWAFLAAGGWRPTKDLAHLWFLYYLLYYYAAALAVLTVGRWVGRTGMGGWGPDGPVEAVSAAAGRLLRSVWAVPTLVAVTAVTLYAMRFGGFDTPDGFVPHRRIMIAYAVFFAVGWLAHAHTGLLAELPRWAWVALVVGVAAFAVHSYGYAGFAAGGYRARGGGAHLLTVGAGAATTWLLLLAATGLFVRYLDRPLPAARYLTDASYWVYLVHLPVALALPALLYRWDAPAAAKFAAVLAGTAAVTLTTYHVGVRHTWAGAFLNGRRSGGRAVAGPVPPPAPAAGDPAVPNPA